MQEFFTNLLDQSTFALWTAFLLGVVTALGPCTLTTNVAAIGFISKEVSSKKKILLGSLLYTLGRAFSYTLVAFIISLGANSLNLSGFLARYGEKLTGPLLIVIGVVMLDLVAIPFPTFTRLTDKIEQGKQKSYLQAFLLGVVFALAFCSYSGVMYFGILIPMTLSNSFGLILPILYAIGTGLIVIIFGIIIAFFISELNNWFIRVKKIELWFRRGAAILFIGLGIYQVVVHFFL